MLNPQETTAGALDIALVAHSLDISGGAQRQLLMLARELQDLGHRVRVIAGRYDAQRCYPDLCRGLRIEALETVGGPSASTPPPPPPATGARARRLARHQQKLSDSRALAALVQSRHTDVVNIHDFMVYLLAAHLDPGPAVVWMLNDAPANDRMIKRARKGARPLSTLVATLRPSSAVNRLIHSALNRIDEIVVLDSRNRELTRRYLERDSRIIRSGVSLPAGVPESRPSPSPGEPLRLFSVGILLEHRRFEDLLRAVALVKQRGRAVRLRIVGRSHLSPAYAQSLRELIRELGVGEEVELVESLSEGEMLQAYRDAHLFVFPHAPQTWGLAVFEAMANGTPVLITTGCGASEVVEHGVHALVTAPFAPSELADAICGLTGARWQELRRAALELVRSNRLTWRQYATNMADVFVGAVQARRVAAGDGA